MLKEAINNKKKEYGSENEWQNQVNDIVKKGCLKKHERSQPRKSLASE